MLSPNTSAGKMGLEQETAELSQSIAAWPPRWAAVSSSTCHDLPSAESWESSGLALNGSRTKPCPASFTLCVLCVRASVMQRGEKRKPVRHRTGALKDILLFVLQLCHSTLCFATGISHVPLIAAMIKSTKTLHFLTFRT